MTARSGEDPYVPGSGHAEYHVQHYDLDLDYRVASNRLSGIARLTLSVEGEAPLDRLTLDLGDLRVGSVAVQGHRPNRYVHRGGHLVITPASPLVPGSHVLVEVHYRGNPHPARGPWGEVGWEELADGVLVAGQPNGAATWFPANDHPRDKASYTFAVTADSPYRVVANGVLTERTVKGSRTRWVYTQREPMAAYLATLQIGHYTSFDLCAGPVRQRAVVPPHLRITADHDFQRQPAMMALFVRLFGPYPFAEYTVVVTADELEIPLEAQGLSVFGSNHLDGARTAERLIAHELAHQWFGNSLTVSQWQDIWLHEGFARYAEWLWSQESGGLSVAECARRTWVKVRSAPQDIAISDPGASRMFDERVYARGALALHALRTLCGDGPFFTLLWQWTALNRHGHVTTSDFIALSRIHAGESSSALLRAWLDDQALPPFPVS